MGETNMAEAGALSPETVMRQMKQNGVTDVVWLPDSEIGRASCRERVSKQV